MTMRLYKTVFWISFIGMLIGAGSSLNSIRNNINAPTIDHVLLLRVKNAGPFHNIPLVADISEDDRESVRYDFKNNLIRSVFYYENYNVSMILFFIFQFLAVILVKKWLTWLVYGKTRPEVVRQ